MTIISVTSIKKAISGFQEDSAQFTTQQNLDPQFTIPDDPVKRLDAHQCLRRF
jgi:hypothetical protein